MSGHLVVRAPNWVGDLVMATPMLLGAVRLVGAAGEPSYDRVSIALRPHLVGVLRDGPLEPHLLPLGGDERAVLAEAGASAVLLLTNSFGAALRAQRARIPVRIGAALSRRGPLLTHRLVPPQRLGSRVAIPTAHLLRDVAALAGIHAPDLHPRLWFGEARAERARAAWRSAGIAGRDVVVCCPGAAFGAAKLWPPERFAAVLDRLHDEIGAIGWLTGAPSERAIVDAVQAACKHPVAVAPEDERDLENLKVWVHDARLLLVGDSGPRWYAAAFDTPCVSVIGPNFEELTASSLEFCRVVRLPGLDCAPCLERVCPLVHHRCMRDLGPEPVLDAAREVLARDVRGRAVGSST